MGQTINLEQPFERESKVFTKKVQQVLALANCVSRELRRFNCVTTFAAVDGDRPFLVVECDQPLHLVRSGHYQFSLVKTPGVFIRVRTLLLGCDIEWRVRPAQVKQINAMRVH